MITPAPENGDTTIAIFDEGIGRWNYSSFPSWNEAKEAVNKARQHGKAAVFYSGKSLSKPPSFADSSSEVSCD